MASNPPMTVDQAKALAINIRAGKLDDNPELKRRAMERLQEVVDRQAPAVDNAAITDNEPGFGSDLLRRAGGALQVGATIATGAIAEPIAGFRGIFGLLTRESLDDTANAINAWRDGMTFNPQTETGREMLEGLAAPLMVLDEAADYVATKGSFGNVYAQTAIYSLLTGGTELLGVKGGGALRISKRIKKTQKVAEELGLDISGKSIAASVVESARDMTPNVRGANAAGLRDALRDAKTNVEAQNVSAMKRAENERAFVDVKETAAFSANARQQLVGDGFQIDRMPDVQARLIELDNIANRSPIATKDRGSAVIAARIQDINTIRNRMKTKINELPKRSGERAALQNLGNRMDEFLEQQFISDMITGSAESVSRWRTATDVRRAIENPTQIDRTIVNLAKRNADPEELHRYLLGTTAMGLPSSGRLIRRVKELLGDNHPAVEGIRQDYLFEVASPLFQEVPDLKAFITNYDKALKNNSSLIKSLDITQSQMAPLRAFAVAALKHPPNSLITFLGRTSGARFFALHFSNHQLGKAALRANMFTNVIKMMTGHDRLAKKAILFDAAQAQFGGPVFPRGAVPTGRAIQAAFLADITAAEESLE